MTSTEFRKSEHVPFFSIIIPTHNRPQSLINCLQSVVELDYPNRLFEVIVIDDGSVIDLAPVVSPYQQRFSIRLIRQTQSGPAKARNHGASIARGELLAFVDDDCLMDPMWLRSMTTCLANKPNQIAGGLTVNGLPEHHFSTASQLLTDYLHHHGISEGRPAFTSNNLAMWRDAFDRLGGFATQFKLAAGEDREFCTRALTASMRLTFCDRAIVYHKHLLNLRGFWRQHHNYGRGAYIYHRRIGTRGGVGGLGKSWSFYINLLLVPFKTNYPEPLMMLGLLLISQVANAIGYFKQKTDRKALESV